jgi:hypothetical protein
VTINPVRAAKAVHLTSHGVLRLEEQPDGRASLEVVRLENRGVVKKSLDLSAEEFSALDAALRESFGRTETPSGQLVLDLPRERSTPRLMVPLPKAPSTARPRRYSFRRHGGRRG